MRTKAEVRDEEGDRISKAATDMEPHHQAHRLSIITIIIIHHPVEVSKGPPGPIMPDGKRGFTMGRGKPLPPPPTSTQTNHEV
ncbi:unnamed protein product [Microthlaspi erraticum]|uniref:Uncharacterized protein n=1 Tax=Microthlaspi erraticum TaxID=1685480 RepID=A0A6D2IYC7_9BRAS|nr:unnamed protein product [Microthlaspi erraticum]